MKQLAAQQPAYMAAYRQDQNFEDQIVPRVSLGGQIL